MSKREQLQEHKHYHTAPSEQVESRPLDVAPGEEAAQNGSQASARRARRVAEHHRQVDSEAEHSLDAIDEVLETNEDVQTVDYMGELMVREAIAECRDTEAYLARLAIAAA